MDKLANIIGDKVGDMVEGAVKNALGIEDKKDKKDKKDEKKGGFLSIFGGDKDEKEKEEDKGGFFSKVFHKDDDKDKGISKKTGFHGLFAEGGGGGAMEGEGVDMEGGGVVMEEGGGAAGNSAHTVAVSDRDLFDDLLDVAEETSNK